jgi:hypothetical protein
MLHPPPPHILPDRLPRHRQAPLVQAPRILPAPGSSRPHTIVFLFLMRMPNTINRYTPSSRLGRTSSSLEASSPATCVVPSLSVPFQTETLYCIQMRSPDTTDSAAVDETA